MSLEDESSTTALGEEAGETAGSPSRAYDAEGEALEEAECG